jgi:imidazoleglycerol-phosphate dehydratase/histidinol-phosphatase
MKKFLFIDRDGTIIVEPQDTFQVNSLEQLEFIDFVILALKKFQDEGYEIIVVSNQDGLGTVANSLENYNLINSKILQVLQSQGIKISDWLTCPHYKSQDCKCRKPLVGMVDKYILEIDLEKSLMIGDRDSDVEFAKNLGIRGFKISKDFSWLNILDEALSRKALINRKTKETDIKVLLNLDGNSKYEINTGLKFLDHMLEQVARHSNFNLEVFCQGDLEIDEHHTIEDIAIALGEAYRKALGDKKGIERFACEKIVPLDEALSFVALDISGRPFCDFKAEFNREYVGDLPCEMISHFFQSFAIAAMVTLHIKIEGQNTHHKVESCFKAFAKALSKASKISSNGVVSTKGVL